MVPSLSLILLPPHQLLKRLHRLAFRIILKYALSVSACFGDSDRSWEFHLEHLFIFQFRIGRAFALETSN